MLRSLSAFRYYQSFRLPVEGIDGIRFLVEKESDDITAQSMQIDDANLIDISVSGLGFTTSLNFAVGTFVSFSLQFRKDHLDLEGTIVRSFTSPKHEDKIIYGVEFNFEEGEEKKLRDFLQHYILSFSLRRLKDCLIQQTDRFIEKRRNKLLIFIK